MKLSKQWITDFVELPNKSNNELGEDLTVQTVEVEEVLEQAADLEHVVVGKIIKIKKHENADSLSVCQVTDGTEELQIVCGGSNLSEGMLVALGKIGAKVRWHGEGDLIELKRTKIRGEESLGMICAAEEIGLGELFPKSDEKEILDLSSFGFSVGTPLADAMNLTDVIFDIDNKSMTNRPDLWGHYGMAREFAAMYQTDLKAYNTKDIPAASEQVLQVSVENAELCPRYMGVQVSGITVGPSPEWMQKRLVAVGVNPINTIVDITNYVMFELGQPMHAFDAQSLDPNTITVRNAKSGEKIVLLGGDEVELQDSMLVIADKSRAIAVAGVKGGEDSGVTEQTTTIVFEAANFHALSTRRTSNMIGVRTDASSRFEKGLDPNLPELALKRAVELTLELCPKATVSSAVVDVQNFSLNQGPIHISADRIRSRIGVDLSTEHILAMLKKLGFHIEQTGEELSITVPTWRATGDIAIPEDIVEEVARLYGYKNIPTTFPKFPIRPTPPSPLRDTKKKLKELLAYQAGYTEVYNYSFVSPEWLQKIGIPTDNYIELAKPIAKDKPLVRRSLIPNMLENVESNLHRYDAVRLFETGRGYHPEQEGPLAHPEGTERLPKQDEYLALVYAEKGVETPFFELAEVVRSLSDRLGVQIRIEAAQETPDYLHGGRSARVFVQHHVVGKLAELHPAVQERLGIPYRCAMLEMNLDEFVPFVQERIHYSPLPEYPAVLRDIAIVVDAEVEHQKVQKTIFAVDKHIAQVELFDVYQGEHVEQGKKSMAYSIHYRSQTETLKAEEVETLQKKVLEKLEKTFGAVLR